MFNFRDKNINPATNKKYINWLPVQHDINFDKTIANPPGFQYMEDILSSGEIKLEWMSLFVIWASKMVEINHSHFLKFVTVVGLLDFRPYKSDRYTTILGQRVDLLTNEMEEIRNIYSLLYLGLCLHMLLHTK